MLRLLIYLKSTKKMAMFEYKNDRIKIIFSLKGKVI